MEAFTEKLVENLSMQNFMLAEAEFFNESYFDSRRHSKHSRNKSENCSTAKVS